MTSTSTPSSGRNALPFDPTSVDAGCWFDAATSPVSRLVGAVQEEASLDLAMTQAAAQALSQGNVGGAWDAAEPLMEKLISGFGRIIDITDGMKGVGKVDIQAIRLPSEYSAAEEALGKYSALGQVGIITSVR